MSKQTKFSNNNKQSKTKMIQSSELTKRQELEKQLADLTKFPIGVGSSYVTFEQQEKLKEYTRLKKKLQKEINRENNKLNQLNHLKQKKEDLKEEENVKWLNREMVHTIIKEREPLFLDTESLMNYRSEMNIRSSLHNPKKTKRFLKQWILTLLKQESDSRGLFLDTELVTYWILEVMAKNNYVERVIDIQLKNRRTQQSSKTKDEKNKSKSREHRFPCVSEKFVEKPLEKPRSHLTETDISNYKMNYLSYLTSSEVTEPSQQSIRKESPTSIPTQSVEEFNECDSSTSIGSSNDDIMKEHRFTKQETFTKVERTIRKGHDIYCSRLEETMDTCPFTGITNLSLLVHSHIKPWRDATDEERLDGYNGLLLEYGYDMLFDKGWVSFENDGTLLVSTQIPKDLLNIYFLLQPGKVYNIYNGSGKRSKYLEYHRKHIYKG